MDDKVVKAIRKLIGYVIGYGIVVFIGMVVWNATIPILFRLPLVSFWQMLGLWYLGRMLFTRTNLED